jgi:hypothetical protein
MRGRTLTPSDEEQVESLRLTHPELDFDVDVRLRPFEDACLATADLVEDRPDVGSGATRQAPVRRPALAGCGVGGRVGWWVP